MAFRDDLIKAIENNGGITPDNLRRIAEAVRKEVSDFTLPYFRRLLAGHPPREIDRQALESALNLPPYTLAEEGERIGGRPSGDIARVAASYLTSRVLAAEFVENLRSRYSFRSGGLTDNEILRLARDFMESRRIEEDMKQFGLDTDDG